MKTPAQALLWELWRRNRGGFVVLLALLLVCHVLCWHVVQLQTGVQTLQAELPGLAKGSFELTDLLPRRADGAVPARGRITCGGKLIYNDLLNPGDVLTWTQNGGAPDLMISLNGRPLAGNTGTGPAAALSVNVSGGGKRTIPFTAFADCWQRIQESSYRADTWRHAVLAWSAVSMCFSFLVLFAVFGVGEPQALRGFTGIPPRRFTLPVRTATLVFVPVGLGIAVMAAVSLAWLQLMETLFADGRYVSWITFAALMAAGLVGFQALVWGLASFPKIRASLLTVLTIGLVFLVALLFEERRQMGGDSPGFQRTLAGCCAGFGACAAGAAWLGVQLERRGHWTGWTRSSLLADLTSRSEPLRRPFRSALQAQFWLEWRRNGRTPLIVWTVLVWVVLGTDIFGRLGYSQVQGFVGETLPIAGFAAAIWAAITGLNLARDGSSKKLVMSPFVAVRPVTSGTLVEAKLLVGATVWLGAVLILAASWFLCGLVAGYLDDLPNDVLISVVLSLFLSLQALVGILPLCLTGRMPGFPWSLLPFLVLYGAVANILAWFYGHDQFLQVLYGLLVGLLILKVAVAWIGFRWALTRRLSSPGFALGYPVLAALTASVLVRFGLSDATGLSIEILPFVLTALLVVPLVRIALSPHALAMNRHR